MMERRGQWKSTGEYTPMGRDAEGTHRAYKKAASATKAPAAYP
jgi:hypothetical protein